MTGLAEDGEQMIFHAQHNRRLIHNAAGSAGHDVLHPLSGRRQCDAVEANSPRSRCGLQGCNLERGRGTHAFIWRKVRRYEEIGPTGFPHPQNLCRKQSAPST